MKKLFVIIAVLVLSQHAGAQISKGQMMLAGSFNYSGNKSSAKDTSRYSAPPTYKTRALSLYLNYGYFITDRIMVGLYGNYDAGSTHTIQNYNDGTVYNFQKTDYTRDAFSAGIFSRYYKMLGKRFALFGQLSAGGGGGSEQTLTNRSENNSYYFSVAKSDVTSFNVRLNPGVVFFLTKHIALETSFGSLNYYAQKSVNHNSTSASNSSNNNNNSSEQKTSGFNANTGFSLSNLYWGINIYFGGKKDPAIESINKS